LFHKLAVVTKALDAAALAVPADRNWSPGGHRCNSRHPPAWCRSRRAVSGEVFI
jgi:hypothetical protein